MIRNRSVSLVLVGLFLWITGCTSYKRIEVAQVPDYGKVRVTLAGGERESIHDPALTEDSIKGDTGPPKHKDQAYAIDDVTAVEAGYTNVAGTVGLILGVGLLLVVLVGGAIQYSQTDFLGGRD